MPSLPPAYRAIILDQQDQLQRLMRTAGVAPVKALYDRMLADVTARIDATPAASFGHQQLTGLLAQIKLGLGRVMRAMGETVEDSATKVGVHAARTLLTDAAKLEQHFTGAVISLPLLEVGRLNGLVQGEIPSLMRAHATSMARFGTQLVGRFEGELGAGLALGETSAKLIDRVQSVGEMEWWRAERVVRTELAFSAGRSARAAADEQAEELDGDLWSRWTEHVSDDGMPLDDRVGVDSEAMHGQVAPPGEPFTQPPANRQGDAVSDSLVGREWTSPPNRPNDRAVLVPWRAHWGVPGWRWEDGRRVPVTEIAVARTNAAWMRSRGRPAELESDDEESAAPVGPGFASPTLAPAGGEGEAAADVEAGAEDEAAPPGPPPIGFTSPILVDEIPGSQAGEISGEIPAHGDLTEADRKVPAADPQAIADHGWYETPGYADDLERAARAYEEVADGLQNPVKIGVTPADNLVVHGPEDAARLNAAVDMDRPIPVRWQQAHAVPAGHVPKAGEDGGEPGFRIGVHGISAEDAEPVAPMAAIPFGRASAAEVADAERRAAAWIADDDQREWAERIAAAKAKAAATPRGTTSIWQPGDETRGNRQVVHLAPKGPRTSEEWYQHDLARDRERQERRARDDARIRAERAAAEAEGRAAAADREPIPTARTRGKPAGLIPRIGSKLRAIGRRIAGR